MNGKKHILLSFFICISVLLQAQIASNFQSENWHGFEKVKFSFEGREAWFVKPPKPLIGNPWVWRAHFPNWHTASTHFGSEYRQIKMKIAMATPAGLFIF